MTESCSAVSMRRAFYFLATLILITTLLYWGAVVLVPLALAVLLAFVLSVPQCWLEQHGVPRWVNVPLVAFGAFAVLGCLLWLAAGEFRNLARVLPAYEETIKTKVVPLRRLLDEAQQLETKVTAAAQKSVPKTEEEGNQPVPVVIEHHGSMFLGWLSSAVGPVLDLAARTVLVVVLTVFILVRRENLTDRFLRLVGPRHLARTTKGMHEASSRVSRYLLLLSFTNTCVGLGVTAGLYFLGVPYCLLWGLLAATLRFIPYLGIWLAALLPVALSVAIAPGWLQPLLVVGLYLALELIVANVVEPLLFGHSTGVTPVALLIAAAFWAWLWGPVGLLLSTPLTVCLVVLGRNAPSLGFLSVLLEDAPALAPAARFYQRLLAQDRVLAAQVLRDFLNTQPAQNIYDEVLLPALIHVRRDRQERQLSSADEKAILGLVHDVVTAVVGQPTAPAPEQAVARIFACPGRGAADELALEMLQLALGGERIEVQVVPFQQAVEAARVARDLARPTTICVVALPPGGLSACVNFCKRVKSAARGTRILIGRWGSGEDEEPENRRLRSAGADEVVTTLLATRAQILTPPQPLQLPAPA